MNKVEQNCSLDEILSDRKTFNDFIYTPVTKALAELDKRQNDPALTEYVQAQLPYGVPDIMKGRRNIVLFRHIATSNYEISRFIIAADAIPDVHPIIFEYTMDKFTNRNEWKYSLGRLHLHKGVNKKNESLFECVNIIDFNISNNKAINTVQTKWGQSLVDFHHELLKESYPHFKNIQDFSDWLHKYGKTAKDYYKSFLTLFLKDGILFENFLMDSGELSFTREIIVPTILEIFAETGEKPLIVALEPTDIEGDKFWLSHPFNKKEFIDQKMNKE